MSETFSSVEEMIASLDASRHAKPWYFKLWHWYLKRRVMAPVYWYHQARFYVSWTVLKRHSLSPWWHYMHDGNLMCPECDIAIDCFDDDPRHLCTAQLIDVGELLPSEMMTCIDDPETPTTCTGCGYEMETAWQRIVLFGGKKS